MQISKSYFVILSLYFLNDMIKVVIFYHLREREYNINFFFLYKKKSQNSMENKFWFNSMKNKMLSLYYLLFRRATMKFNGMVEVIKFFPLSKMDVSKRFSWNSFCSFSHKKCKQNLMQFLCHSFRSACMHDFFIINTLIIQK